jgi:aryl-alcohol dehydrogenase-like predicted oxidoreductase
MLSHRLGTSGLSVSELVMGCMSFGESARGPHEWTLDEDASRPIIRAALEAGITTFDTADQYSAGSSEEIVGRALGEFARREEIVIATKVFFPTGAGPNTGGLSRKHIMAAIDASLTRLGTDYVDLYQIHRFDPDVTVEETMETLHGVVESGKARYLGASSMWTWQFAKMQYTADLHGWTRFVSMQDQYNLIQREEEREMFPFAMDQGIGILPWSPLARGRLTRAWDETSARSETDKYGAGLYRQAEESDRAIVDAVAAIANQRGVSRAQVALAWVRQQPAVTAPIIGATKQHHLDDAVASLALELNDDELATLAAPYSPRNQVF